MDGCNGLQRMSIHFDLAELLAAEEVALRKSHEESLQQRLALMEGEMQLVLSGSLCFTGAGFGAFSTSWCFVHCLVDSQPGASEVPGSSGC